MDWQNTIRYTRLMSDGTQRRLAAIVSTDVVGYSRLMGRDEAGTLRRLNAHRSELIDPLIAKHGGRIVKTTGDGLLLEFPSVVAAVECCIAVQEGMTGRSAVSDDEVIQFRIGVHLGDVIVEGDDIFGDGVNIAARLQEIGDAGGVTISSNAHDSVDGRIEAKFVDGGNQELKNIARSVRVWRWANGDETTTIVAEAKPPPLPDKPSIAVLPFDNMSGDPEQEYFSDGVTEDIITALSKFRWFFVTARNSTFVYKGKANDVKQVGRELGVRYVLEGSVRKADNRIRITAQLIETETGNHIWAERFDRELEYIFDLQDELTQAITSRLDAEISDSERQLARRKTSTDLGAWDYYQRGMWHFNRFSKTDFRAAREQFETAIECSPTFAAAYAGLAFCAFCEVTYGYVDDIPVVVRQGARDIEKALALDNKDSQNYVVHGRILTLLGDHQQARLALERALALNSNSAETYGVLASTVYWCGGAEEAIPYCEQAILLSPRDPQLWFFEFTCGACYLALQELDAAVDHFNRALQAKSDEFWPYSLLASAYGLQGNLEAAQTAYKMATTLNPELTPEVLREFCATVYKPYMDNFWNGYRQAGLPEHSMPQGS